MTELAPHRGVCPACHRDGRVGHPCDHAACQREGVHFIPERFVPRVTRARDPRLGHVIARHLLIERLHRRGIDVLYRAVQIPALLEVELAFAPSEREQDVHDNLYRQALALGRLGAHPNTTRLVLFGADAGGTFLATESEGDARMLSDVVTPEGNDPVAAAPSRVILEPLAAALGALARAQLVHGEIRPEHVLVREEPGYPAFIQLGGFVRIPAPEGADASSGSDDIWRAPEQLADGTVNPTTDAYAVAAIAFALLVGRPPFPADDRDVLLALKADASYDVTSALDGVFPTAVGSFLRRALAFDPAERLTDDGFRDGLRGALEALERAEAGLSEQAEPASPTESEVVGDVEPAFESADAQDEAEPVPEAFGDDGTPLLPEDAGRHGRPPRFHRESAPALEPEHEARAEDLADSEHEGHKDHGGSTQQMSSDELESLASQRPTPRMHKGPETRR